LRFELSSAGAAVVTTGIDGGCCASIGDMTYAEFMGWW
jgi:hypothetical protein